MTTVALRKESVDRNRVVALAASPGAVSLSARRAWIEIRISRLPRRGTARSLSARRAWIEIQCVWMPLALPVSLSARRAWIEIVPSSFPPPAAWVALRKESVDRNWQDINDREKISGRSPQGERG